MSDSLAKHSITVNSSPTSELFMLYHQGVYSKTLLCREQADELATFIHDATGVEVGIKQVRIGFDICHSVDVAEGWIDDTLAIDPNRLTGCTIDLPTHCDD